MVDVVARAPVPQPPDPTPGTSDVSNPADYDSSSDWESLADTGGPAIGLVFVGLLLVVTGSALVSRRRRG